MVISRSRNSYIRSLRRVTLAPITMPSRSLKPAIDVRALVGTGFWPAIFARSAIAALTFLELATASPMPMLMTILSSLGICISLV